MPNELWDEEEITYYRFQDYYSDGQLCGSSVELSEEEWAEVEAMIEELMIPEDAWRPCSVFTPLAGVYTVAAGENVQASETVSPIRISSKEISSGGKVSMGLQPLIAGTECRALLIWVGTDKLTIVCISLNGIENQYFIGNGKAATFRIPTKGEYTIAVKNNNATKITEVNGTIEFIQNPGNQQLENTNIPIPSTVSSIQGIVYENVEMRSYEGEDGYTCL